MGSALGAEIGRRKVLHIPSVVRKASFEYQRATDGQHMKFSDRQVENITRAFERIKAGCGGKLYLTKAEFCEIYDKIEQKELDVIFRVFDIDRSNMISLEQIIAGLGIMCRGTKKEKLLYYFKGYDLDQNGHLDKDEVTVMLEDLRQKCQIFQDCAASRRKNDESKPTSFSERGDLDNFVRTAFQTYDANKDGRISHDEFSTMMADNQVGQRVTERLEYICNRILYSKINNQGPNNKTPKAKRRKTEPSLTITSRAIVNAQGVARRHRRLSAPAGYHRRHFTVPEAAVVRLAPNKLGLSDDDTAGGSGLTDREHVARPSTSGIDRSSTALSRRSFTKAALVSLHSLVV